MNDNDSLMKYLYIIHPYLIPIIETNSQVTASAVFFCFIVFK
jgi:hypothetical protein